jgi:formylglycine-generating enzyme required for sulfatase activity
LELVRDVYGEEYGKAKSTDEKTALAEKLLDAAKTVNQGTANHYALLRVAWDVTTQAGDAELAMQITDAIGRVYEVDSLGAKLATIKTTDRFARTSAQKTVVATVTLVAVDEAVSAENYDVAKELTGIALAAARKSRDWQLVKRIVAREKEVNESAEAHKRVQPALATLEQDPMNAEANQATGEYFCFVKGDWGKGIPMLALGSDAELKSVATMDLRGATSADQQVALGDAWWTLAESREGRERESAMVRAGFWYQQAMPNLGGLIAQKVENRMGQISELGHEIPLPPQSPPTASSPFDEDTAKQHQAVWAEFLKEPYIQTNSIGMKLVLIPPGEFLMGSSGDEVPLLVQEFRQKGAHDWVLDRVPAESPQHRVKIVQPFYLGIYEVRQSEYERVMGLNPSKHPDNPNLPVDRVTWNDAVEFCRRLSELPQERAAGRTYRLPTEAEWEYACRAGTITRYSFGDDPKLLRQFASWFHNSALRTQPVGTRWANPWGLFDVHGNAWEWCADWYAADYYRQSPTDNPGGPAAGVARVLRGGSCKVGADGCRCAFRFANEPDKQFDDFGFRVVRIIAP